MGGITFHVIEILRLADVFSFRICAVHTKGMPLHVVIVLAMIVETSSIYLNELRNTIKAKKFIIC